MLVLHDHYGHWLRQKMKGPSSWQGKFVMNVDKREKKEKKDRSWLQTVLDQEIRKVFTSRHNHTFHVTSRTTLPDSPPHTQLISHICFLGKLLTTRSICCRSQIPWSNFDFCQVIIQTNIRSKKLVNVKPALLTCPRWSVYLTNLSSSFTWRSTIPVMHRTTVIFWYCGINSHHMRILRPFCMQLPHVCLVFWVTELKPVSSWSAYSKTRTLISRQLKRIHSNATWGYLQTWFVSLVILLWFPEHCMHQERLEIKIIQGVAGLKSSISGTWVDSSLSLHVVRAPVG